MNQICRELNENTDVVARLATVADSKIDSLISVELLSKTSTNAMKQEDHKVLKVMAPTIKYFKKDGLLDHQCKAWRKRVRLMCYLLERNILYKKKYARLLLRCLTPKKGQKVLKDIHDGGCDRQSGSRVLANKILRLRIGIIFPNPGSGSKILDLEIY